MAYREVRVFEIREVLRLRLAGHGLREVERLSGVDRKTVRRYVTAAEELGLVDGGGEGQLTDGLISSVVEAVRPHRFDSHGESWRLLVAHHQEIIGWLEAGLTAVKVGELLERKGVRVPGRTLHRYTKEECWHGRGGKTTVRVTDGEPGESSRSTSDGWDLCPTPAPGETGYARRLSSLPPTRATASCG